VRYGTGSCHDSMSRSMSQSPHPWRPPAWDASDSVATYIIRSLPEGIATSIETSCRDDSQIREWLARWMGEHLDSYRRRAASYSDSQAAFLYIVVAPTDVHRNRCDPTNWKIRESTEGTHPYAPEEWPERQLVDLVEFAIHDLREGNDHDQQGSGS
jgi:hypothetical protein